MAPDSQLPTDPPSEDVLSKSLAPGTTDYNKRQAFTCGGCDNTWTGMVMAHCPTCHTTFGSVVSFDRHRRRADPQAKLTRWAGTPNGCIWPADLGLYWNDTRHCWSEAYSAIGQLHGAPTTKDPWHPELPV